MFKKSCNIEIMFVVVQIVGVNFIMHGWYEIIEICLFLDVMFWNMGLNSLNLEQ
jgi:hypothetical protein